MVFDPQRINMTIAAPKKYLTEVDRKLDCELAISLRYDQLSATGDPFASQKVVGEALDAGWSVLDIQAALDALDLGKEANALD
jgi:hypothetical protein